MVPLLVVAVQTQGSPDGALPTFRSPLEIAKTLGSLGYPYKSTGADATTGEISKGTARVWVGVARIPGDTAKGVPDTYPFIDIQIEFAAPKAPSMEAIDAWHNVRFQTSDVTFVPHLGGTVTEHKRIQFSSTSTRQALKEALDGFFAQGTAFAKAFGLRYATWTPLPEQRFRFAESTKVDRADYISFERATASWGWKSPTTLVYSSQGWMLPMRVNGEALWLRQATAGAEALPRAVEVVRYSDEPAPSDYWQKAQAAGDAIPSYVYDDRGPHAVLARTSIDLSKGVSLGELRRRIAEFASVKP